ncbi:MAG TPA: hypothetical protein VGQ00_04010 [Candidatus Norongarragalinales archaeon]|jgi:hypothetical protein|nr:hypothetical protein [Candidatus Norongarragalinales archaeon]
MLQTLTALFEERELIHTKGLQLRFDPLHRALTLNGYISLSRYEGLGTGDERYKGGESRQVKSALAKVMEHGNMVIEVSLEPSMNARTVGAYHFHITETLDSLEDLVAEVDRVRAAGFIDACYYPVHGPEEEHLHKEFRLQG